MKERLSGLWVSVRERWSNTTKQLKILLLGGIAAIFIAAMVIVSILGRTDYIVLYNNLTVQENAEVMVQLQSIGVQGRLEGNALLIPQAQENAVRMHLAVMGQPMGGTSGFDIFQMGGGLTATQADRDFFANAQAEANLVAMIRTIPEVRDASVVINRQEAGAFIFESERLPAQVAVVIERMPGRNLRPEQVQGMVNLILTSVPGVSEENISIMDSMNGDLRLMLTENFSDRHQQVLRLTEQVNDTFRRRVLGMLVPVYGEGRVEVQINSVLDTSDRTTESVTYIPFDENDPRNNPVNFFESEFERTLLGGAAEGVPGATDNIDVPMYAAEADDGDGVHVYARNVIDFLVSSEHTMLINDGMDIVDMSVAVLIDSAGLPAGDRDVLIDLVAAAAGVAPYRVSVQSLPFATAPVIAPETSSVFQSGVFWGVLGSIALLVAGLGILMIRARKKKAALAAAAAAEAAAAEEEATSLMEMMSAQEEDFEPIVLPETPEQKLKGQIKDLADSDPEIVAQLIKTWLVSA